MGTLTARYPTDCRSIILQSNRPQQLASEIYLFFSTCPYIHIIMLLLCLSVEQYVLLDFFPSGVMYVPTYHGRVAVCAVSLFLLIVSTVRILVRFEPVRTRLRPGFAQGLI